MQKMKQSKSGLIVSCMAVLTVIGCSSAGRQPDWVNQPAKDYPADQYLTAIASADDRDTAADRAISNLAKIFEVEVDESSLDFSSAKVASIDDVSTVENEQQVSRRVSTTVNRVVEGAKVSDYWEDQQGRVYALARLNKAAATGRFHQAILASDREINNLISYAANQADNPIAGLRALQSAREVQVGRDQDNQSLMIVADGKGLKGRYDLPAVDDLIRQALASLQVVVSANDKNVKKELQQALARLGVQSAQRANLALGGTVDFAQVEQKQGWYWLRGSYELTFADGETMLAKQRWPVKVSSTDRRLLEQRARDDINRNLPSYVYELMSATPQ